MVRANRYYAYRYLGAGLVSAYLVVMAIGMVAYRGSEIFPFFNWSLFSYSSNERIVVVVGFDKINDKALPLTRLYYDLTDTFSFARARDIAVDKTIARLARAIRDNDAQMISSMRKLLEERYMAEIKSADYRVLELTHDPIKRLRTGEIKKTVVLAAFQKGGQ